MSTTPANDPFFEDEEDLARAQATPSQKSAKAAPAAKAAPSGPKPPSFALVVGIAVVALLLGIAIGYFFAMSVVDRSHSTSTQPTATSSSSLLTADEGEADAAMPEGHPDIASMMNPDGSVNEEAVEAFKAQRAADQEGQEDQDAGAAQDAA